MKELKKTKYEHYLSFELLPAGADPFYVMKVKKCDEFFDKYTRDSIRYMRNYGQASRLQFLVVSSPAR